MHFTQLLASAAVVGSALSHVPGVVHDTRFGKREIVEKRAECSRNNLLRALVRFQDNGTEAFCRSYLGDVGGTATVTIPGGTETLDATITETPEPVTEVVTEVGTVTALAAFRRQASISVPAGISQYANDTRLSSGCACLLYSTSIVPVGVVVTVTGPADATATATETVTADGTTTTATSFETIIVPRSSAEPTSKEPTSEPTACPTSEDPSVSPTSSDPSSTSSEPSATATGCVTGEPIIGCVFGSIIISADLITEAKECPALCEAIEECVAYQVGVDEDGVVAYCETLNAPAAEALDEAGTEESAEYCGAFAIFDYTCPAIVKVLVHPAPLRKGKVFKNHGVYLNSTTPEIVRPTSLVIEDLFVTSNISVHPAYSTSGFIEHPAQQTTYDNIQPIVTVRPKFGNFTTPGSVKADVQLPSNIEFNDEDVVVIEVAGKDGFFNPVAGNDQSSGTPDSFGSSGGNDQSSDAQNDQAFFVFGDSGSSAGNNPSSSGAQYS